MGQDRAGRQPGRIEGRRGMGGGGREARDIEGNDAKYREVFQEWVEHDRPGGCSPK